MAKAVIDSVSHDTARLLRDAEKVFSGGLIRGLESRGAAILEGDRTGCFIFDEEGNRYFDCFTSAGTYNLGRKNPEIINVLRAAARETDQGNFVMLSEEKARLGERLAGFLPGGLECALLTVVRGEAMDAACKLARGFTGRKGLVTVEGGWYGQTGFALSLSRRADKRLFGNLIPGVIEIPFGNIDAARKVINRKAAAFIIEPVQAENHCRTAAGSYFREIRKLCSKKGVVLIFDETQTGFGRTGRKFACEHFGVSPDILVFGEAITGGIFPMTGMAFTRKLKSFFDAHPLIHLCTFGGHDVGCRVACAVMDMYERLKPWQNALLMGEKLREKLNAVREKYPEKIKSVAGMGLLLSMEFPDGKAAGQFCVHAMKHGLYVVPGETSPHCVVLRPSLVLSAADVDTIGEAVSGAVNGL